MAYPSRRISGLKVLLVVLVSAAVFSNSYVVLFCRILVGSGPACPLTESVGTFRNTLSQTRIADRLEKASHLERRDPDGFELWVTPRGSFWIPHLRMGAYFLFQMLAEEERMIYGTDQNGVQHGGVVLDCGANVGAYTRTALDAGAQIVVAIEPAPDNLICLRRNFSDEIAAGRVVVYGKGVWDREAELELSVNDLSSGGYGFGRQEQSGLKGPTLPVTTIDKLVSDLGLRRVDLIKMDIEGAEQRALLGAKNTVTKYRPRLAIAAEHAPDDQEKISALVRSLEPGYRMECGRCAYFSGMVRREALFFH